MPDIVSARIAVPQGLEATGPAIMRIAQAIDEELRRLQAMLNPLRDYWSGQAHLGWADLQRRWDAAANQLMSSAGTLGSISHATTTNWNNYVDGEAANVRTWSH